MAQRSAHNCHVVKTQWRSLGMSILTGSNIPLLMKKNCLFCVTWKIPPLLGFVRFDVHYHYAEVSINLNPRCRGKGFAKRCLTAALERFQREFRKPTQIIARIKIDNEASQRLFTGAGFSYLRTRDNIAFFHVGPHSMPEALKITKLLVCYYARVFKN